MKVVRSGNGLSLETPDGSSATWPMRDFDLGGGVSYTELHERILLLVEPKTIEQAKALLVMFGKAIIGLQCEMVVMREAGIEFEMIKEADPLIQHLTAMLLAWSGAVNSEI